MHKIPPFYLPMAGFIVGLATGILKLEIEVSDRDPKAGNRC